MADILGRQLKFAKAEDIIVNRDKRQRKAIDVTDLIESVKTKGVLHPIIVDKDMRLIAGERRLTCCLQLGIEVPYRFANTLDPEELEIIELEENTKRMALSWQDTAVAYLRIYEIQKSKAKDWKQENTAEHLGVDRTTLGKYIDLGKAVKANDQSVITAPQMSQAVTILARRKARSMDTALNDVLNLNAPKLPPVKAEIKTVEVKSETTPQVIKLVEAKPVVVPADQLFQIKNLDAIKFMNEYEGDRFNFIHCDFPYGVPLNGQAQQENFEAGGYDSNPELYWELCHALCKNYNKLTGVSSHIMFWISMKFYTETINFFAKHAPQIAFNPVPLIWHKSDGKGILPDARRGPRQIYEPALIGSTGDRNIVRPVSNVYGAPTGKAEAIHTNEKPMSMLKHFCTMFVDEHTIMLDPTCGSGSSVRVAESLGAKSGTGLELNPEFCQRASQRLKAERDLRMLSEKANG